MKLRLVEPGKTPAWQFKARIEGAGKTQTLALELWCDGFPVGTRFIPINQELLVYKADLAIARAMLIAATNAPDDTR